jgi:hypothetical protein
MTATLSILAILKATAASDVIMAPSSQKAERQSPKTAICATPFWDREILKQWNMQQLSKASHSGILLMSEQHGLMPTALNVISIFIDFLRSSCCQVELRKSSSRFDLNYTNYG